MKFIADAMLGKLARYLRFLGQDTVYFGRGEDSELVEVARTEERCLLVYPEPKWREILPKIEALPSFNKAARRAQRLLIGHATPLELDSAGRVLVPPTSATSPILHSLILSISVASISTWMIAAR